MLDYIPDDVIVWNGISPDNDKTYAVLLDQKESESGDLAVGLVKFTDSGDKEIIAEYDFFDRYSSMLADTGKPITIGDEWNEMYNWVSSHSDDVIFSWEIINYFERSEEAEEDNN